MNCLPAEAQRTKAAWKMLIGLEKKFIFVANSKAASTAIETLLRPYADIVYQGTPERKHLPLSQVQARFASEVGDLKAYFIFGVLRDPKDWILSWYRYRKGNAVAASLPPDMTFAEFWAQGDWNICTPDGAPFSQSTLFLDEAGHCLADVILPYENLTAGLARICSAFEIPFNLAHENVSRISCETPPEDLTENLRAHYAQDYALRAKLREINACGFEKLEARRAKSSPVILPDKPSVSIVMPVYNIANYVTGALVSVQKQSFETFEVLVVDDGSADQTTDVVAAFAKQDRRFRLIQHPHQGLSVARNIGLAESRAAVIGFLDGDDAFAPDFLVRMLRALQETETDWVACGLAFWHPDGRLIGHSGHHSRPDLAQDWPPVVQTLPLQSWTDIADIFPSVWNKVYRRAALEGHTFTEGAIYEDHEFFWSLAARLGQLAYIPRALYHYRRGRTDQITGTAGARVFEQFRVLDRLAEITTEYNLPKASEALSQVRLRLLVERLAELDPESQHHAKFTASARAYLAETLPEHIMPLPAGVSRKLAQELLPNRSFDAPAVETPEPLAAQVTELKAHLKAFPNKGQACVQAKLDFTQAHYANIDFLDSKGQQALLHLSLRHKHAKAVLNTRDAAGWGAEIVTPWTRPKEPRMDFEASFHPEGSVTLRVDGKTLFSVDPKTSDHRFSNLQAIAHLDVQGAFVFQSLEVESLLDGWSHRLEIHGHAHASLRTNDLMLYDVLGPTGVKVSTERVPFDHMEMRAVIPGWLWRRTQGHEPLKLWLKAHPGQVWQMTRADLRQHVLSLLETCDLRTDPFVALQVIEHCSFSGIVDDLPTWAMQALEGIIDHFKLPPGPAVDPIYAAAHTRPRPRSQPISPHLIAQAQLVESLRQTPSLDLETAAWIAFRSVPARDRHHLFYSVVEVFLDKGEIALLARLVDTFEIQLHPETACERTLAMPLAALKGDISDLLDTLTTLKEANQGWISTRAMGWGINKVLDRPDLQSDRCQTLISETTEVLQALALSDINRLHCRCLVSLSHRLVQELPLLPTPDAEALTKDILQLFGLIRGFWEGLERSELPGLLAEAYTRFQTIQHKDTIAWFVAHDVRQSAQIALDFLGPAAFPVQSDVMAGSVNQALRLCAAPERGEISQNSNHTEKVGEIMPDLYMPFILKDDYETLERRALVAAQTLLRRSQPPAIAQQDNITRLIARLSHPGAVYSGIALGLSVITACVLRGWHAAPLALIRTMENNLDRTSDLNAVMQSPAVQAVLPRLKAHIPPGLLTPGGALARMLRQSADLPTSTQLPLPAHPEALLHDTLVVIITCRSRLASHIPPIRETWLQDLKQHGVAHVIVSGGGPSGGRLTGDHLEIDAPDDYEHLPLKILKTLQWLHENTDFAHILKIDDDCYLNVSAFFQARSYKKVHYYGRALTLRPGQMDRSWHQAKVQSKHRRYAFDKSPEPSVYADGGTGYVLSRYAMDVLCQTAQSPLGQRLREVSFMEDKLIGDLLACSGILCDSAGYCTTIRRRSSPSGPPVSTWVSGFDPSRANPVKVVHLDTPSAQHATHARLQSHDLKPSKIWPTMLNPKLGPQSNALELVSPPARLRLARKVPVAVVAVMRNEKLRLGAFLEHYRALGVEAFLIADNLSSDGTREALAAEPDVSVFSVDTDYAQSSYGVLWQQALLAHYRLDKWSLIADADEFIALPPGETLPDVVHGAAFATAEAARVFMLDLYPKGRLHDVDFTCNPFDQAYFCDRHPFLETSAMGGPFSNAPTWTSALRHRLLPGSRSEMFVAQKIALLRYHPFMRFSEGLHYVADARLSQREFIFGHFKYATDFQDKAQNEARRGQHFNAAEEYKAYHTLSMNTLYDPSLSMPWTECSFVKKRLTQSKSEKV